MRAESAPLPARPGPSLQQEDWTRKLVHRRAMEIYQALENGTPLPSLDSDEISWLALEVLNLITAGEWLEATKG